MAEACGTAYYRYGAALFYRAQEDGDILGGEAQSAAAQRDAQVGSCPLDALQVTMIPWWYHSFLAQACFNEKVQRHLRRHPKQACACWTSSTSLNFSRELRLTKGGHTQ